MTTLELALNMLAEAAIMMEIRIEITKSAGIIDLYNE